MSAATAVESGGYFGEAQAARGETLYAIHCSACHGRKLEGTSAVPLAGEPFKVRWADADLSIDDLFYIVRTQMPYGEPGILSTSQYLDIVMFLLKSNDYPAARDDLPRDPKVLSAKKLGIRR